MTKPDDWLKLLNLFLTDTLNYNEFFNHNFDINKVDVNTDNCISLYNLVYLFNKLYLSFKKEYSELDKLDLGKNIEVRQINEFEDLNNNECRFLSLYIDEPYITNRDYTILKVVETNNKIDSYITDSIYPNPFSDNFYHENINLNQDVLKKYLDLFEKYHLLFSLYNHLKRNLIYADGTNILETEIDNGDKNLLLDDLDNLKINISSLYWLSPENKISLSRNLGENFGIEINNSSLQLYDEIISIDEDTYIKILNNIYISGKYLDNYRNSIKITEKEKVKLLKKQFNFFHYKNVILL